jgi:probable phosphoglycerate mutase
LIIQTIIKPQWKFWISIDGKYGMKSREQGSGNRDQEEPTDSRPGKPEPPKAQRLVLEGYVKNGVIHLLEGELPDGIFVKVVRE